MNDKQATIAGLEKLELKETFRSRKYRTFEEMKCRKNLPCRTFLVGKSGALRVTRSTIARSISKTGSRQHKAIQYIGRLNVELPPEALWEIYDLYVEHGYVP